MAAGRVISTSSRSRTTASTRGGMRGRAETEVSAGRQLAVKNTDGSTGCGEVSPDPDGTGRLPGPHRAGTDGATALRVQRVLPSYEEHYVKRLAATSGTVSA